jgi:type I restriction enzyme M protein
MLNQEIKSKITQLWDMFWAGGLSNPITAIEQISYLLFMKRLEDVRFSIDEEYRWSFYTTQYYYNSDRLLIHIKEIVFPYIKNLQNEHEPFTLAMQNANFEITKPSLLHAAIELINAIYEEAERERRAGKHFQDTLGDFYEHLLKQTSEAGKNGQFRTPRHIIEFICELIKPNINDTICDVTAGTSGFLVGAYQYIINKNSSNNFQIDENGFERSMDGDLLDEQRIRKLKTKTFYGFDIDPTMIRLGLMNLMMHDISEPHIKRIDSLSKDFDESDSETKYSKILANPPFTGRIDSLGIGKNLNRVYDLKPKFDKKLNRDVGPQVQSEILFLERIVYLLEDDGMAAVIVPEGVLFGSANAPKKIREILLKDCDLQAVISLPSGVFMPYAGVKTSILLFQKKQFKSDVYHTEKVWFYGMDSDGYTLDASRKPLKDKPLPRIVKSYDSKNTEPQNDRKQTHFYVPIEDIIENNFQLSYNQYKAFVYKEQEYQAPKVLLAQLFDLEKEILKEMEELNSIL